MKHTFKKWLAVLLSLAMIFSTTGTVFADDEEEAAPLEIDLSRGTIDIGGSTYFQLSELGNVLGFNVGYDAATRTVLINSK